MPGRAGGAGKLPRRSGAGPEARKEVPGSSVRGPVEAVYQIGSVKTHLAKEKINKIEGRGTKWQKLSGILG